MNDIKACPFCGVETSDVGFIAHTDGCYLILKYLNADKAKLIEAWNHRAHEEKLIKLLLDAKNGTRDDWNVWLREITELCGGE